MASRLPKDIVWRGTDYRSRTVSLHESVVEHIVEGHEDMGESFHEVYKCIEDPLLVYRSSQSPNREVFFGEATYPDPKMPLVMKSVVEYSSEKEGLIVTSFRSSQIGGGIVGDPLHKKGSI